MIFLKKGKTNWKYILIVVILATIVGGIALYCLWKMKWEIPITKFPLKKEISEQKALELANQVLQSKCKMSFTEIKKVDWTKGGPGFDIYESICPEAKNYKENKIWVAEKKLNENYQATAHVGINGKFVCVFASTIGAAPGGPFPLDQACPKEETANWKTYRNEELKFEFKYPDNYKIDITGGHSPLAHPELGIRISIIPKGVTPDINNPYIDINLINPAYFVSLDDYISKTYENRISPIGELSIGNIVVKIYKLENADFFYTFLRNESSIFDISSPSKDFLVKVLSTFRFLE
jgi:hypothetical protein